MQKIILDCFGRPVIMFACNTLCVSVPHPETLRQATAWRKVSGCHVHCKESLGEKCKSTCSSCTLATDYGVLSRHAFLFVQFPFKASLWQVLQTMSAFVVMRQRCLRVFTGSQVQAFGFAKKIFLFPIRASVFVRKKHDSPKPCILIADETKVTDTTDYAYKKSQHDEKR